MRVAVAGLWHLGTVTAACCAAAGHEVIGFDDDQAVVNQLCQGNLPVDEPGLADLVASVTSTSKLSFSADPLAVSNSEILWICYDTPVDENDQADIDFVISRTSRLVDHLNPGTLVLVSSQLPVGSIARLEKKHPGFRFACSPENLRLGKAIEVFTKPDRVVVGIRNQHSQKRVSQLFAPITDKVEWMAVESAEMTKHAINAFLATSITFINEIAGICEKTGADALEVERGLKTDVRIGPKAYLHAGGAFAGGTLARDIQFLRAAGAAAEVPTHLFSGVLESNSAHRLWTQRQLSQIFGKVEGKTIAVLGLTYKPGTNTLRRSSSIETCRWLIEHGAKVQAFDPAILNLPTDLQAIHLAASPKCALSGAEAVLIATPWPEFQSLPPDLFKQPVLDPSRHLEKLLTNSTVDYYSIGVAR